MGKFRRLSCIILCTALSGVMSLTAYADYIVQPGVVLGGGLGPGSVSGPGSGDANSSGSESAPGEEVSPGIEAAPGEEVSQGAEAAPGEGSTSSEPAPGEETSTGSESAAPGGDGIDSSAPGVVVAPDVEWEPLLGETLAPGDAAQPSDAAQSTASADELIARSLASPNTLIPATDPDLFYINGRLLSLSAPSIALTYDDGPNASVGNRIMDLMEAYGGRCTFFLVGNRVPSRVSEVQRMVAEGFEVGNHTYEHAYLNTLGASAIQSQVSKCNSVIAQYAGVTPALMRLPGGNKNSTVLANVAMPIILWNVDTRDWETRNAQSTISAVVGKVKDGDIVLMHELYESTATANETIIPTLVSQGFQLVTVSELAALKGVTLQSGHVYYSF